MRGTVMIVAFAVAASSSAAQSVEELYRLAESDRPAFAEALVGGASTDAQRASQIIDWLGRNFDWTATDYETRTVEEIIERRGGNCAELARVAATLFEDVGVRRRRVREINVHVRNDRRQATAESMVAEHGLDRSVFGRRHNDHVWLEVYDDASDTWSPVDPSLGVAGLEAWLRARAWFGDRTTLDPTSNDMLFPMAILVLDSDRNLVESRTRHYMVESLDALYGGALSKLPSWGDWVRAIERLERHALAAFQGRGNLHDHAEAIEELGELYERLRHELESSG